MHNTSSDTTRRLGNDWGTRLSLERRFAQVPGRRSCKDTRYVCTFDSIIIIEQIIRFPLIFPINSSCDIVWQIKSRQNWQGWFLNDDEVMDWIWEIDNFQNWMRCCFGHRIIIRRNFDESWDKMIDRDILSETRATNPIDWWWVVVRVGNFSLIFLKKIVDQNSLWDDQKTAKKRISRS